MGPLEIAVLPCRPDGQTGMNHHVCEEGHPEQTGETLAYLWKIPATFYGDHVRRDLPGGIIEKQNKVYNWVWLSEADRHELRSDADYYTDTYGPYEYDKAGRDAARRCLRALSWGWRN